jgi:hypothetical protein
MEASLEFMKADKSQTSGQETSEERAAFPPVLSPEDLSRTVGA